MYPKRFLLLLLLPYLNAHADGDPASDIKNPPVQKNPVIEHLNEPGMTEIVFSCGNQLAVQTVNQPPVPAIMKKEDTCEKIAGAPTAWIQFFEQLIKLISAIAWPAAAIVIAFYFKKELAALMARLKKGKVAGTEFEFENYVREVNAEADIPRADEAESISPAAAAQAGTDPRGAILGAWISVEEALFDLVKRRDLSEVGTSPRAPKNVVSAIRAIQKANLLDSRWIALFQDLRVLRNEAAHSNEFSPPPDSIMTYVQLSKELVGAIRNATYNAPIEPP